jgi:hypothetical protein
MNSFEIQKVADLSDIVMQYPYGNGNIEQISGKEIFIMLYDEYAPSEKYYVVDTETGIIRETQKTSPMPASADESEGSLPVVIFNGITLDTDDRNTVDVDDLENEVAGPEIRDKYERDYYLYSDGEYKGIAKGIARGRGLDYGFEVCFFDDDQEIEGYIEELAISANYNPYPRTVSYSMSDFPETLSKDGSIVKQVNSEFGVECETKEMCRVDLDGDGTDEYLAYLVDTNNYFYTKCLLNSNFKIIAYITVLNYGYIEGVDWPELFDNCGLSNSGEIADVNNDEVMEILVELPAYEGFEFRVFSYKNGVFSGDYITKAPLLP